MKGNACSVPLGDVLKLFVDELARLLAAELRAVVQAELRRLVALQIVGDEWTCSVPDAAQLLGIDRNTAYAEIHRTGSLAGVPVLRVGERYRVSKLALAMRLMGEQASVTGAGLPGNGKEA
jgi:hypothetical protein